MKYRPPCNGITSMIAKEQAWKNPPVKRDYVDAKQLLTDFGITIQIPIFETVGALQAWTKRIINAQLV